MGRLVGGSAVLNGRAVPSGLLPSPAVPEPGDGLTTAREAPVRRHVLAEPRGGAGPSSAWTGAPRKCWKLSQRLPRSTAVRAAVTCAGNRPHTAEPPWKLGDTLRVPASLSPPGPREPCGLPSLHGGALAADEGRPGGQLLPGHWLFTSSSRASKPEQQLGSTGLSICSFPRGQKPGRGAVTFVGQRRSAS